MTSHLSGSIAFRWSIASIFFCCAFGSSAQAQPAQAGKQSSVTGVYNGTYDGAQGPVKFKLSLTLQDRGILEGEFTVYVAEGADTKAYICDVKGRFIAANRRVQLIRGGWKAPPPAGFDMPGMNGVFDPEGGNGAGKISGTIRARPAPNFEAVRDADESAKMAIAPADKPAAAAKAAAAPGTHGPVAHIPPNEINGVYTGTYGSNPDDKVPAKLYVKFIDNGSVNGVLDGLFTLDVPPSAGAKPITYTYKLIGVYAASMNFWSAKPVGKPAPDAYALKQIYADFGRGPTFKNSYGQLAASADPDQISAKALGSNDLPSSNKFEGKRDKDASAKLDTLMAAVQASATSAVSTAAPSVAPAQVVRPDIVGVFNGTYTRDNEPATKFKLTITRTSDGLAGLATIYLPTASGTKAYTYSLKGALDGRGAFHLLVYDWETMPPKDFKNFKAMGFNGELRSNLNQNTARIISAPSSGLASPVLPEFEAEWDATESADIRGAIAAQKAVGDTELAAALKAREQLIKNAPPKELASKDLVRKSRKYWDGYHTDMIREVFDGGFGAAIDEDGQFQQVFCTYVETFSARCSDCLPANHQTVTVTQKTNRRFDRNGNLIGQDTRTFTIEMDARFVEKYQQFPKSLGSSGAGLRGVLAAGQPGSAQSIVHDMLAVASDMQKFFADHRGRSAAMRQMNENFVRAISGEPSLQQADAKIDGAQAESDKDALPGRYARFVDAANSYFRARAKASPARFGSSSSHDTALCQRLAELYQVDMSRDEEYYYANDFEGRYLPIMGTRASCPDPAWPQLHPDVERAIEEVK